MARIRSVHPGVATDEDLAECSRDARLFFILLGTETDDYGCFEWKPLRLKMRLFPADDLSVEPLLEELFKVGKVMAYQQDGKQFGAIRNFCKFQKPKSPRGFCPRTPAVNEFIGLTEKLSEIVDNDPPSPPPPSDDAGKPPAEGRKGGREEGISEANASGEQVAVVDPAKQLFDTGVAFLAKKGVAEKQARSVIGKLRSRLNGSSDDALWIVQQAIVQDVTEPVAYFEAMMRDKAPGRSPLMEAMLERARTH